MKADLHCHTKLSDGALGIDDLLILAKKSGVTTLAITDHDCLAGTVRAKIIGERYGITVIPAVELSCTDPKRKNKAHLLCYFPDKPERLEGLCKRNSLLRKNAGKLMVIKASQRFPITPEFIVKCASVAQKPIVEFMHLVAEGLKRRNPKIFGSDAIQITA